MKWNAEQYETQHAFVFKYGANLLDQVPKTATSVLDVGCGTGDLTDQLRQRGCAVLGIDVVVNVGNVSNVDPTSSNVSGN